MLIVILIDSTGAYYGLCSCSVPTKTNITTLPQSFLILRYIIPIHKLFVPRKLENGI